MGCRPALDTCSQVAETLADPEHYFVYVVDHLVDDETPSIRVLHEDLLRRMIDRSAPRQTYWPTFRVAEYDSAETMG